VLETRTEGWIAGLQLAALSMQGRADVSGFIAAFTGSSRYILDYLVEEVLIRPTLIEGRWLLPGEGRALVISTGVLAKEPDVEVDDEIVIKIKGRETTFRVVGIALGLGVAPWIYASYDEIARITGEVGWASSLMVVTEGHDASSQARTAAALEAHLRQARVRVNSVQLVSEESAGVEIGLNIMIVLSLVMALLLAVVGGLGLMGTLSINVLERTREIGVMRAIGATDSAVAQVFIVESVVIGVISWLSGTLSAIPLSRFLSDTVGTAFLQAPLSYTFAANGALLWLVAGVIVSVLASLLPARNASRLTVREVLAYE
jgi:putative ABC transport system permease protein